MEIIDENSIKLARLLITAVYLPELVEALENFKECLKQRKLYPFPSVEWVHREFRISNARRSFLQTLNDSYNQVIAILLAQLTEIMEAMEIMKKR